MVKHNIENDVKSVRTTENNNHLATIGKNNRENYGNCSKE